MKTHDNRRALRRSIAAMLVGAACLAGGPATAASTQVVFSGTVSSISVPYAIPGIEVGEAISGSLDYDPATSDTQPLNWIGLYQDAISRFSAVIGDQTFAMVASPPSPTSEIVVLNDDFVAGLYRDSLYFRVAVEDVAQPGIARFLQLTFSVGSATRPSALQGDALPATFDPADFQVTSGFVTYLPPGASQGNNLVLTEVSVTPVPEPQSWHLLAAGMTLLLALRHRERLRRRP
ncbi:hypothetical protein BSY238_1162 [Methyloversatilis sp. RAC08]|uniref:hypothetical protein n=1 Tax=Methyloversatilis sp. RAC08 TaxID=1842540 RepID=UPI0008588688|nr:hypothetical protein [Methyloversatilis sp. RAC08]AOF82888.1 hypothetical protein BSY238_1162 [Methyloversatilis sp. RAC08]